MPPRRILIDLVRCRVGDPAFARGFGGRSNAAHLGVGDLPLPENALKATRSTSDLFQRTFSLLEVDVFERVDVAGVRVVALHARVAHTHALAEESRQYGNLIDKYALHFLEDSES